MRELADFNPSTGHLHDCPVTTSDGVMAGPECPADCASYLYVIAQDAEAALARVEALLAEWDALSKRETGTTQRIRRAIGKGQHG